MILLLTAVAQSELRNKVELYDMYAFKIACCALLSTFGEVVYLYMRLLHNTEPRN